MGLLTDLYNKVAKFFRQQEGVEDEASKSVATSRLKLVLMQDRTNLTPKILEQMRGELVDLLSKYLEMDKDLLELNFEQEGDQVALMLSIPVIRAKDEDEIEEALAAQRNAETEDDESEDESDEEENDEEYIESIDTQDEGVNNGANEGENDIEENADESPAEAVIEGTSGVTDVTEGKKSKKSSKKNNEEYIESIDTEEVIS